ncbi:MAG: M28 family peptidase, partial [Terriglobia bacterium]
VALALAVGVATAHIRSERWLEDVKFLASPDLKGRGSGSPELNQAANYIAEQFKKTGLEALNGSYFQPFEAVIGTELGQNNQLALSGTSRRSYRLRQDFVPLGFSGSGDKTAGMVFVGYGITAPEYNYDDYAGIDVTGKVVLVLRHEPQEQNDQSVFRGREITRYAALVSKAITARNRGAAAMVLVNDPVPHSNDRLISLNSIDGPSDIGIPVIQVTQAVANEWVKRAGRSLEDLQKAIDRDLSKQSFPLPPDVEARVQTDVRQRKAVLRNVVGYLPGTDPAVRDRVIVIGAHYDHLGLGEQDSLAPNAAGQIHHGADDNASGTAGIMELARFFSEAGNRPRHSLLFMAFSGEEKGLLGSAHYVEAPFIPLDRTVAMMNLDMIGRVSRNRLYVGGVGTSPQFRQWIQEENQGLGFQLDYSDSGYGASDHMSFVRRNVPVLFFFSGLHADYHKPTDTWEKQMPAETAKVLDLISRVVKKVDATNERLEFVRVQRQQQPRDHGNEPPADPGQGYGAYFGSIPDFGEVERGVKFADVRDGSPAAQADLRSGDILIQFDGKEVRNLYDFTDYLRAKRPGEEVPVVVLRGGQEIRATVKLGSRQ